ncbi:hypothetical protein BB560_003641 [Smittium megazygosporum]|uniref:Hsp90 chaperone protein kinase-targeting subunit n=1 Tax=Smittium megazygosporum TaxID=133381 RepID=A0A2T9ZBI2_9FUNG|nr:hypothetical protein BB560_003641 [Smittium megazygosporum]
MPIDYSKWDNLEISDDSDVEIHPNIEKGTFIRLRQQKIRQDRERRAHTVRALESELEMNKKLAARLSEMISEIKEESKEQFAARMLDWSAKAEKQEAILNDVRKALEANEEYRQLEFDELVDTLVYRVQQELAKSEVITKQNANPDIIKLKVIDLLHGHIEKLKNRDPEARAEIENIKKEQRMHISADEVAKEGYNKTFINKQPKASTSSSKNNVQSVELLNPGYEKNIKPEAEVPENTESLEGNNDEDSDEESLTVDPDSMEFGMIDSLDKSKDYILEHRHIIGQNKSDQLLVQAFRYQMRGESELAKQFVRQSLILTYIHQMGPSGINIFFSKIVIKGNPGNVMFFNDIEKRYNHIVERCKILKKEQETSQIESIQLQTDSPDSTIRTYVPDKSNPDDKEKWALFEQLPVDFQEALKTGTIDAINQALAKIPGSKAEEILQTCGKGGFLVIDEEILVDADQQEL